MDFDFDLREWAEWSSIRPGVLSAYLELGARPNKKLLARQGKALRELYRDQRPVRENLLAALKATREFIDDEENLTAPGLAVFADPSRDLFKTYLLPRAVGDLVVLDTSPYIRPLVRLEDNFEPFGLVLLDNARAQLYLVDLGRITDSEAIKTNVISHQKNGGWSQARYSRRRKNKIADFMREVARELDALLRKEQVNRIILAGPAESKRLLSEALPQRWQRKVVGFIDLSMDTDENTLLKKVFPLFHQAEADEEGKMLEELRDRLASDGLATAGLDTVSQAVAEGRAERVLVASGYKPAGWKCERCEVMDEGAEAECVLCGERVYPVDLVEEIVEYAQKTAAEVVFVDAKNPLIEAMDGIGAYLRY